MQLFWEYFVFCMIFSFPLPQYTLNMSWCKADSVEYGGDSTT